MPILTDCPSCAKELCEPDTDHGKIKRCPDCQSPYIVHDTAGAKNRIIPQLTNCPACKKSVSILASTCPDCGYPLLKMGATMSSRSVSGVFTLLCGVFYFAYNGWWKSTVYALLIDIIAGALFGAPGIVIAWILIGLTAQKYVDSIEGY